MCQRGKGVDGTGVIDNEVLGPVSDLECGDGTRDECVCKRLGAGVYEVQAGAAKTVGEHFAERCSVVHVSPLGCRDECTQITWLRQFLRLQEEM